MTAHSRGPVLRWLVLVTVLAPAAAAPAHESRPAYLDISETAPHRYHVLWRTPVLSGMPLPVALRLPEEARTVGTPSMRTLSDSRLERRVIAVPEPGLAGRRIEFAGLQATITDVLVRVRLRDGRTATTLVRPSQPWIDIAATRGFAALATDYVVHGLHHIAFGFDHLLFVLGLLLIVKDRWMLLKTITAFTIAHSITLAIATFGSVAVPLPPLNAVIALSILFLGPEIVRSWRGETSWTIRHPWVVAFLFGLLHGFGFATALTDTGLPRYELDLALVSFNVGVEVGQLAFVLLIVALERAFRQLEIRFPRLVEMLPAYAVGTLGAFWTIQRTAILVGVLR